ncbi:efflux RND transporter periplasmic adaptor subunit [Flavihumibacter stibioxidans]|uniref:CzcB-like barrel-sandwich hybrid domain-containing protein n=1 Tax=Flavihumibacter stibioxidans TaxID=1834163 RepID=A0ABR7MCC0_9BACT|nr:efflux RND transporter periplasmic adaptor subunit [Flavihumibacter stibioxidans]MBC6492675.1 hypothetical protein [Flavihumibacter stibioxidans]
MNKLLMLLGMTVLLQSCGSKPEEKTSDLGKGVIPVKLVPINRDSGQTTISVSGLLSTENEARLSFKIGGVIESITVKEGDRVRKGQLLATLKSTEISAQVQQVQLAVEKAERDYQRASNLYKDSVATLEQLQNAKTGMEIARQNLQQASFNQQYSKIYAPADGFIVRKLANVGELTGPGNPVLFMNASSGSSKWILKAGLSDQDWAAVATGNKASVQFDAYPGQTFPAVISKKALAADPVSGSFQVEMQVDFGTQQPAVGMFGTASITPLQMAAGFRIPYEALLEANGKTGFVFVSDDSKTVKKVEVTIASFDDQQAYISAGLEGHAFVVSSGSPYLADGSAISVQK